MLRFIFLNFVRKHPEFRSQEWIVPVGEYCTYLLRYKHQCCYSGLVSERRMPGMAGSLEILETPGALTLAPAPVPDEDRSQWSRPVVNWYTQ